MLSLFPSHYALAAARALPHATQIADRWHLMENASRAFLETVQKFMRTPDGSGIIAAVQRPALRLLPSPSPCRLRP